MPATVQQWFWPTPAYTDLICWEEISCLCPPICACRCRSKALGVECLSGSQVIDLLEPLSDPMVEAAVLSERYLVESLQADCSSPVGAYAFHLEDGQIS